ncbi:hypothetical protein B296_00041911 [Ensete ventricosum]|uniref:Uncharacterized protein n=1 Tax=Ensete ventricosum TaxID=4639 RepID=A0A426XLV5_ENSVE|nr:hypothetical protein B296_00041911 [Ensete ventricosum]
MLLRLGRSVDLKGNERSTAVVDLLSFDNEKKLVVPSLQSTKRQLAIAHTSTLGKENRATETAGGMALASRSASHVAVTPQPRTSGNSDDDKRKRS